MIRLQRPVIHLLDGRMVMYCGMQTVQLLREESLTIVHGQMRKISYKYTGNTTVTAQWSENSYNIEFKANKPSKASNNVSGDLSTITNVKYTQSVTLKCAPSLIILDI